MAMVILDSVAQRRTRRALAVGNGLPPERLEQILQHAAQAREALTASLEPTAFPGDGPEAVLALVPTHRAEAPAV